MLKMLRFEIRKIISYRYFVLLISALIIASSVICFFRIGSTDISQYDKDQIEVINDFVSLYKSDPIKYQQYLAQFDRKGAEKAAKVYAEYNHKEQSGEAVEAPAPEDFFVYSYSRLIHDGALEVFGMRAESKLADYSNSLGTIIRSAKINASELKSDYGYGMDDYQYYYQCYVYDVYKNIQDNVKLPAQFSYGFDDFFSYSYSDLFLCAALILIALAVFLPEKQNGMVQTVTVYKNGRTRTALAKIAVIAVISELLVLIFTAIQFIITGYKIGFSDFSLPIQNVEGFTLFPFAWSIGKFFVYYFLIKSAAAICFAFVVALLSLLLNNVLWSYAAGIGVFALSFLAYKLDFAKHPFLQRINSFSQIRVTPLCNRLYVINLFGECLPITSFALASSIILSIAVGALLVLVWSHRKTARSFHSPKALGALLSSRRSATKKNDKKHKRSGLYRRFRSVFAWEVNKQFIASKGILIFMIAAILIGSAASLTEARSYHEGRSYKVFKKHLLPDIDGDFTENEERFEYLIDVYTNSKSIRSRLTQDKRKKLITKEEYDRFTEVAKIIDANLIRDEVADSAILLEEYRAASAEGAPLQIIDYMGYSALFSGKSVYLLFVALLVGCITVFSNEYSRIGSGAFAPILRSMKKGRGATLRAKLLSSALSAAIVSSVVTGVDILFKLRNCNLDYIDARLCSLPEFFALQSSITIRQYIILLACARIASSILLAVFCCAVSLLSKNAIIGISTVFFVNAFPHLLLSLGMEKAACVDCIGWLSVSQMLQTSAGIDFLGSDFGYFALFGAAFASVTAILAIISGRKYIK